MSKTSRTKAANGYLSIDLPDTDLEQQLTLDSSGNVTSISVVYWGKPSTIQTINNVTYTQTFTRNGSGIVTNISQWVPQP